MFGTPTHRRRRAAARTGPVRSRRIEATSVLVLAALIGPLAAGPALAADGNTASARALAAARNVTVVPAGQGPARDIDRGFRGGAVIDLDELDKGGFQKLIEELRSYVTTRVVNGIPALDAARDGKYLALPLSTEGKTVTLLLNTDDLYLEAWERATGTGKEIFPLDAFHAKWEEYARVANKSAPAGAKITVVKTGLPENYTQLGGLGKPNYGRYPLAQTIKNLHDFKVGAGKPFVYSDVVRLAVTVSEATRFKAVEKALAGKWELENGAELPRTHQDLINEWKNITRQLNEPGDTIKVTLNGKTKEVDRAQVREWIGVQHSCAIGATGVRTTAGIVDAVDVRGLLQSKGSTGNPCGLPEDDVVDRSKVREQARAEAEKLPGRARERAEELCAKSGHASCLEIVDWKEVREQARADAERLTELKLAGVENMSEVRLVKDLKTMTEDPSAFYVPYDKTRAKLGGDRFNPESIVHAGGAALWVAGVVAAFAGESSDLDKAAAVTALLPVVGNLLQVGVDVQDKDLAGIGVDGFALLMEGLELAGVESAVGGPAFALAMAYHLSKTLIDFTTHQQQEMEDTPAKRDKAWHDVLLKYLQDPKEGWLAKSGGTEAVAAGIALMQAAELQRAGVKGLAHVASTAADSGTVQSAETNRQKWSASQQFKDADAKVDDLTTNVLGQVRTALAASLAKGMNAAWGQEAAMKFNQQFIDKVKRAPVESWCPVDGRHSPEGCLRSVQGDRDGVLAQLEKAPPGVTAAEVEDILENLGMTDPGFLPVERPFRLANESDGGKWYLHFDQESGKATHAKDATDPARQEFLFRTTGRISNLEGVLCIAGGKKAGDPVTVEGCTHRDAPEQRWEPDDKGRIKNVSTGLYLDSADPNGHITTWSKEDGDPKRQTWKAETPTRSMSPQAGNDAISKLLSANGSSQQIDAVVPNQTKPDMYYLISGANIMGVSLSSSGDELKLSPGDVKKTTDHWESLAPLFAASRDSMISAGMRVPGRPGEMYLFSGDKYARLGADGKLVNEPRGIEDNWNTLKGLFAKSGTKRVDAVRPIPGVEHCFQIFSGSYSNQICLNGDLEDRETRPVQRNAERWPEIGANTGKDSVQGFMQATGKPMANYVFTAGQYTYVDRSLQLPAPSLNHEIHGGWTYATLSWSNTANLPEGTKIVIRRDTEGRGYWEYTFNASDGKLSSDSTEGGRLLYNAPNDIVGATSYTLQARYTYTHPDGTTEESPSTKKSWWCSFWECNTT